MLLVIVVLIQILTLQLEKCMCRPFEHIESGLEEKASAPWLKLSLARIFF